MDPDLVRSLSQLVDGRQRDVGIGVFIHFIEQTVARRQREAAAIRSNRADKAFHLLDGRAPISNACVHPHGVDRRAIR